MNNLKYVINSQIVNNKERHFGSLAEALAYIRRLQAGSPERERLMEEDEARKRAEKPDNQGMNDANINEIVGRYLAANPDTAKRLVQAATQYEAIRVKKRDAMKRYMECTDAAHGLDEAIEAAQKAVNALKGDILRLQKERKVAAQQAAEANEFLKSLS